MAENEWIKRYFAPAARTTGAQGLQDDVAIFPPTARARIITVDTLIERVHFLSDDPIDTVARKLVRVNVSDILAKGAEPAEALLALSWPSGRLEADLAEFAGAFRDELDAWGIALIGGDTTSHNGPLHLTMTLTGTCLSDAPISRMGAAPGQDLWVTGSIGASGKGLKSIQNGVETETFAHFYRLPAIPPLSVASIVAGHATAALDVSDGLLIDVLRLAEASGVGVRIDLKAVPVVTQAETVAQILEHCTAGDDYQVLFSAEPSHSAAIRAAMEKASITCTRIGSTTSVGALSLFHNGTPVNLPETLGFEHS